MMDDAEKNKPIIKVRIGRGEWYPVYSMRHDDGDDMDPSVEVTEEFYWLYKKVMAIFEDFQGRLKSFHEIGERHIEGEP